MHLDQMEAIKRWVASGAAAVSALTILAVLGAPAALSQMTISASPAPNRGTPITCGTPVESWGAATADDVRVQLLTVQRADVWGDTGTPMAATPAVHGPILSVTLEIANLGQDIVRVDPADIVLTTCSGTNVTAANLLTMNSPLGAFEPGETRRGQVQFPLDGQDSPASLTVRIQEQNRTGAQITCPLVLDLGTAIGRVSAGCSAQGGSGRSGATGSAVSGITSAATTGAGQ